MISATTDIAPWRVSGVVHGVALRRLTPGVVA
jgi:hypothetical protein